MYIRALYYYQRLFAFICHSCRIFFCEEVTGKCLTVVYLSFYLPVSGEVKFYQ